MSEPRYFLRSSKRGKPPSPSAENEQGSSTITSVPIRTRSLPKSISQKVVEENFNQALPSVRELVNCSIPDTYLRSVKRETTLAIGDSGFDPRMMSLNRETTLAFPDIAFDPGMTSLFGLIPSPSGDPTLGVSVNLVDDERGRKCYLTLYTSKGRRGEPVWYSERTLLDGTVECHLKAGEPLQECRMEWDGTGALLRGTSSADGQSAEDVEAYESSKKAYESSKKAAEETRRQRNPSTSTGG